MWIYMTSAVTSHVYGTDDTDSALYNEGADWVGICFAIYNGIAAVVAFILPFVARRFSRRITHLLALFCGGLGLISVYFISDPNYLLLSMVGVGIAWASILSMPYAIISSILPPNKMGYYMGVFNFFIVIPQIVAGAILGWILATFFGSMSIYALLLGGASFFLAGLLCLIVEDNEVQVDFAVPKNAIEAVT
jgi:maltose/moltooligosaccharide transporter